MKNLKSILKHLTASEKEEFFKELLALISFHKTGDSSSKIKGCLDRWKDVAELNSIPNFKKTVWERFKALKDIGKIVDLHNKKAKK